VGRKKEKGKNFQAFPLTLFETRRREGRKGERGEEIFREKEECVRLDLRPHLRIGRKKEQKGKLRLPAL